MNIAPRRIATLIDILLQRAAETGTKLAFTFQGQPTTYAELSDGVDRFGSFLLGHGLRPGARVIVALPNGPDFFSAFYGIQRAGGVAVPLFPAWDIARILRIAGDCEASYVVVSDQQRSQLVQVEGAIPFLCVSQSREMGPDADFPAVAPDDLAFIQYTSGSSGEPKGVMIPHANLLTNMEQMIAGMEITPDDVFVSWLPVYHDMGLILMTMVPFYMGLETHLLPADLGDVSKWLKTIDARGGSFTAAPDFAYRLCLRHADANINISSLRVALNAAEPVRAQTIRDFESKFRLHNVMTAGYGLAEATVGVSMSRPGHSPKVNARGLVSVGLPFPEVEVQIVDGDRALPAGEVGEIAIRSPAGCRGYYNSPEATRSLFRADRFLLSGDLGCMDEDGSLYIVGRKKNTIKHAGETIAPQEVEEIVDAMPGVRFSTALGIDRGRVEGEQLYVFAEVKARPASTQAEEMITQLTASLHARLGLRPARVLLLKAHAIPRTHNGKIQHTLLREQYLSGELRQRGLILFPDG